MDHIFLTDNNSEGGGALLEGLAGMFSSTFLTLRTDTYEHAQLKTYAWCAEEHRHSFNWMAFLDMDEFLIVHSGCAALCPTSTRLCACAATIPHPMACMPAPAWSSGRAPSTATQRGGPSMTALRACEPRIDLAC